MAYNLGGLSFKEYCALPRVERQCLLDALNDLITEINEANGAGDDK